MTSINNTKTCNYFFSNYSSDEEEYISDENFEFGRISEVYSSEEDLDASFQPYPTVASLDDLQFNVATELTSGQLAQLAISMQTQRSQLEEFSDSIFSFTYLPSGQYIITRKPAERLPSLPVIPPAPPINLPIDRKLAISEVRIDLRGNEALKEIAQTARLWNIKAGELVPTTPQIRDLRNIAKLIFECAETPDATSQIWDRALVCRDVALNHIQALALIKEDGSHITLAHIVTHPNNVRHEKNNSISERVLGAGTAIMRHIAQLQADKPIYLESTLSAAPFYERFGFVPCDTIPSEPYTIPMLASPAQILKNLEKSS